jgi:hypothetical protein
MGAKGAFCIALAEYSPPMFTAAGGLAGTRERVNGLCNSKLRTNLESPQYQNDHKMHPRV